MKARTTRPLVHQRQRYQTGEEIDLTREDIIRYGALGLIEAPAQLPPLPGGTLTVSIACLLYKTTRGEFDRFAYTFEATTRTSPHKYDLVFVDNTEKKNEDNAYIREQIRKRGWKYIDAGKNLGFAAGANLAAKYATGHVLIFINDDIAFPGPWADALIEPLRDPNVGAVGPKLIRPGEGDYAEFDRADWVCGAVFAVRRFEFLRYGGFDERFFFSGEETDYCNFIRKIGKTIVQIDAPVIHYGGETVQMQSEFAQDQIQKAIQTLNWKWNAPERITGSMIVHNEAGRYLEEALNWLLKRADTVVITDDASTDGTWDILQTYKKQHPHRITLYKNTVNEFTIDEHALRQTVHLRALRDNPAFIIPLDADEELTKSFDQYLPELKKNPGAYNFPIIHLWGDRGNRRIDGLWGRQANIRFYNVQWNKPQDFYEAPIHCGSAPIYAYQTKVQYPAVGLIHKGWIRHADFKKKTARNKTLDPSAIFEPQDHLEDENPITVSFTDTGGVKWEYGQ